LLILWMMFVLNVEAKLNLTITLFQNQKEAQKLLNFVQSAMGMPITAACPGLR